MTVGLKSVTALPWHGPKDLLWVQGGARGKDGLGKVKEGGKKEGEGSPWSGVVTGPWMPCMWLWTRPEQPVATFPLIQEGELQFPACNTPPLLQREAELLRTGSWEWQCQGPHLLKAATTLQLRS